MSTAGISFGGLASGLDTNAIISALVALEQRPITQLEAKKTSYGRQKSLFGDLDGLLDKLTTAAKALKTTSQFLSMKVASDNEDIMTATASSGATPGTHQIWVGQLARAQVNHTSGWDSATTAVHSGYGEFLIDPADGDPILIAGSDMTLESIAAKINNSDGDISAEVVDTGSATDPYQLVIRSTETGQEGAYTISHLNGGTDLQDFVDDLNDTNNVTAAQDALIRLNGVQIQRSSNSITGAIPNVTIDLKSLSDPSNTDDTTTLAISTDAEEVGTKITSFVEAYNELVDFFEAQNQVDEEGSASSALFGDPTLRSIRSNLRWIVGGVVDTTGNEAFQMLSQMGIKSDTSGKLTFTQSEFEEALAEDEQAVAAIFSDPTNGLSKLLEDRIDLYTDSVDGLIKTRLEGYDRLVKQTNDRIEQAERRLEQYQIRLENKYANLESLLARLQGQGSSVGNIIQQQS